MAGRRETEPLEPIDEAIARMVSELPGRNVSERRGSLEIAKLRRPSVSCLREGSRGRRSLADAATPLRRGESDGTAQGHVEQPMEKPSSSRREIGGAG